MLDTPLGDVAARVGRLVDVGYRVALVTPQLDPEADRSTAVDRWATIVLLAGPPDTRIELRVPLGDGVVEELRRVLPPGSRGSGCGEPVIGGGLALRPAADGTPMIDGAAPQRRHSGFERYLVQAEVAQQRLHRCLNSSFRGSSASTGVALAERISADTPIGHALAFCLAVEDATATQPSEGIQHLRAFMLELERLCSHADDIYALCADLECRSEFVKYPGLFSVASLRRIMTTMAGHPRLQGAVRPGDALANWLPSVTELRPVLDDLRELGDLVMSSPELADRLGGVGIVERADVVAMGAVGYVARASGIRPDARHDHPFTGIYDDLPVAGLDKGDALSRFRVRAQEIETSVNLVRALLPLVSDHERAARVEPRDGPGHGIGIVEGPRGSIVHRVELDRDGNLSDVAFVDPSHFNWAALGIALSGHTIDSDFALANASLNLSFGTSPHTISLPANLADDFPMVCQYDNLII